MLIEIIDEANYRDRSRSPRPEREDRDRSRSPQADRDGDTRIRDTVPGDR